MSSTVNFKPARKNQLYKSVINICCRVVKVIIIILEYVIIVLKHISEPPKKGSTINTYQSLTNQKGNGIEELMLHHFGKLHEHNYIASIVHRHEWVRLRRDIEEFLTQQVRSEHFLKEEMSNLKMSMGLLLKRIDQCKSTTANIPNPPPLPPLSFIDTENKVGEESQKEKRMFKMDIPFKPFITVEDLKSVKLKKTMQSGIR